MGCGASKTQRGKQFQAYHPPEEKVNPNDPKNSETFKYCVYDKCPTFTDKHLSLMSKLIAEHWDTLKDKKTSKGYTLHNCIQTGVQTPHLGVGITAGDDESWEVFKDIMYPIINGWHNGFDPATMDHKSDLDYSKVKLSDEQAKFFDEMVVSTRIRAARNVAGLSLPAGTDAKDRAEVEALLKETFANFSGELKGKYHSLGEMKDELKQKLRSKGMLFQLPKPTNLLTHAGAARDWPNNRGIFLNNDDPDQVTALCWCNEEDHCRIISMQNGGNIKEVFARFCTISAELSKCAKANGTKLMEDKKLGFLGTCPSNLGTGLRASVMIKLPELNKDVPRLEALCEKYDLQPRGSAGEHSAAVGGKWDISNKQRIGFTEVELVQKMIDGVWEIVQEEKKLQAAA